MTVYAIFDINQATAEAMERYAGLLAGTIKKVTRYPDGHMEVETAAAVPQSQLDALAARFGVIIEPQV
jgi:hypothetical protein